MSLAPAGLDLGSPFAVWAAVAEWAQVAKTQGEDVEWGRLYGVVHWTDDTPPEAILAVQGPARRFLLRYGARLTDGARGVLEDLAGGPTLTKHYGPGDHPDGSPQQVHAGDDDGPSGQTEADRESWSGYALTNSPTLQRPPWVNALPRPQQTALLVWAGSPQGVADIRKVSAGARVSPNAQRLHAQFIRALSQAPEYEGPAFRGLYNLPKGLASIGITKPGQTITLKGVASASKQETVAVRVTTDELDFSWGNAPIGPRGLIVILRMDRARARDLSSFNSAEQEVVLRPHSKFRVKTIHPPKRDRKWANLQIQRIDLEAV